MKGQTILFISDMRQVYLAEILTKKGICVRCLDVRNRERAGTQLEKLETYLAEAGRLILPVPVTKIPDQERLEEILRKDVPEDVLVFGGCFSDTQKKILRAGRICFYDFMDDEQVSNCRASQQQPL